METFYWQLGGGHLDIPEELNLQFSSGQFIKISIDQKEQKNIKCFLKQHCHSF